MPAQFSVCYLLRHAGEAFAAYRYFNSRVFDHVLAPVLSRHFTRRSVKAPAEVNQPQFHRSGQAGFPSNCGEIGNDYGGLFEIHRLYYRIRYASKQADALSRA